jgi:RecQ-mediated genome instability protein 1
MLRRRLRLTCSSDDEDENPNPNPNPNPDPDPSEPVAISDDDENGDFIDVSDNFIPSSPPPAPASEPVAISDNEENGDFINASDNFTSPSPPHPPAPASDRSAQPDPVNSTGQGSDSRSGCPVGDSLLRLGLSLKTEWLDECLNALQSSVPGFASLDVAVKAKLCFERFLTSDMNLYGNGVLPPNVDSMHLVDLPGPYVLQVRSESRFEST